MKVNVIFSRPSTDHDFFDSLYGYWQNLGANFVSPHEMTVNSAVSHGQIDVLVDSMPERSLEEYKDFDLVLLSNDCEGLAASTQTMTELPDMKKIWLLNGARLHRSNPWYRYQIWHPFMSTGHQKTYWTSTFYPHYYSNVSRSSLARSDRFFMINGKNYSWRHHVLQSIAKALPDLQIRNSISQGVIHETNDSFFESPVDSKFKDWVNSVYDIQRNIEVDYYDRSVAVGPGEKFGKIAPGYDILPEYFSCPLVIFPETTYINDSLQITEKGLKCFFAKTWAWPISGRHTNTLYNEVGFSTAWNLLPKSLQEFDYVEDHVERFELQVRALTWLHDNPQVLYTPQAQTMLSSNFENFIKFPHYQEPMIKITEILEQHVS